MEVWVFAATETVPTEKNVDKTARVVCSKRFRMWLRFLEQNRIATISDSRDELHRWLLPRGSPTLIGQELVGPVERAPNPLYQE